MPSNLFALVKLTLVEESINLFPGGLTSIVRVGVFVAPPPPVARITKSKLPCSVGAPVIAPVELFKESPGGKEPEKIE